MTVDLPLGEYTITDIGGAYPGRPYQICLHDNKVSVLAVATVTGPTFASFTWNLEVEIETENLSDLNQDGTVDAQDLAILLSNWGTDDDFADIDKDGIVGPADLEILLSNWT